MNHFLIEVDYFGEWTSEGYFNTLGQAFEFGKEFFSSKIWRVIDSYSGIMVYSNDPLYQTRLSGGSELDRFNEAERRHRIQLRDQMQRRINRSLLNISSNRPDFVMQNISARHLISSSIWHCKSPNNNTENINWKKDGF